MSVALDYLRYLNIDLFNFKEYDIYSKIILNDKDKSEAKQDEGEDNE